MPHPAPSFPVDRMRYTIPANVSQKIRSPNPNSPRLVPVLAAPVEKAARGTQWSSPPGLLGASVHVDSITFDGCVLVILLTF